MSDVLNHIRGIAETAAAKVAAPRWGFVVGSSYNAAAHTVKVMIQPDDIQSDDLPIAPMGGARYAPVDGQMAFLVPESQDSQSMVVSGFAFNNINVPPKTKTSIGGTPTLLNPGEWEAISGTTSIRLTPDGTAYITAPDGLQIEANITIKGNMDIDGYVKATENVESAKDVKDKLGTLDHLRQTYDGHTHPVHGIGSPTSPPNQPDN
jgi:hypothetical protein